MNGTPGSDIIFGTEVNDLISGLGQNDSINGLGGDDSLNGNNGNDTLYGGEGNDQLNGGGGDDFFDGGEGEDLLYLNYSTLSGNIIYNAEGEGNEGVYSYESRKYIDTYRDIELVRVIGTGLDDEFTSLGKSETLNGAEGSDLLNLELSDRTDDLQIKIDSAITENQVSGIDRTRIKNFESVGEIVTGKGDDSISLTNTDVEFTSISGGEGSDTLDADFSSLERGIDYLGLFELESINIVGTDYNDTLKSLNRNDSLNGGAGTDHLELDLSRGEIADLDLKTNLNGSSGGVEVDDEELALDNFETGMIIGGEGNDTITLDYSTLSGSINHDTLGQEGYGRALRYDTFQYVISYRDFENVNIMGTGFADTLMGNTGNDSLVGNSGADSLVGHDGDDSLFGGTGNDFLQGNVGDDYLIGVELQNDNPGAGEIDLLSDKEGNNVYALGDVNSVYYKEQSGFDYADIEGFRLGRGVIELHGDSSNYALRESNGDTRIFYGESGSAPSEVIGVIRGVTGLNLNTPEFRFLQYDFSQIMGTDGDDTIVGNKDNNNLKGRLGNDLLEGKDGNDTLIGERGADDLDGGAGDDSLFGGEGEDFYMGGAGRDRLIESVNGNITLTDTELDAGEINLIESVEIVNLIGGNINNFIDASDSTIYETVLSGRLGDDTLLGGAKQDTLIGDEGNDFIEGGGHEDRLLGGEGDDILIGGEGNDFLRGDEGDDILFGDLGSDLLIGGAGADTFVIGEDGSRDVILDFEDGVDYFTFGSSFGFDDLKITGNATGTVSTIRLEDSDLILAVVRNVDYNDIGIEDFT